METLSSRLIRPIRSFVSRQGRTTQAQLNAWDILWPRYGLPMDSAARLDLDQVFGRASEKILEIGFGNGHSLIQMARNAPEKDFIGVEVYQKGIANLLLAIEKEQLTNIRIFFGDVLEVLKYKIPPGSLMTVQIFFPDPWPKKRHHKRRLIQLPFVDMLANKLKENGSLHLATDWMDYAYHMLSVISANKNFLNLAGEGQFIARPTFRPLTKYEKRGLQAGYQTWDLIFNRI